MLFPPFIATILGFIILMIFGSQNLDTPVISVCKDISLWGALILIGVSFQDLRQLGPKKLLSKKTRQVVYVRFLIAPIFAILFILIWDFSNTISFALLIQCMAPPAVSNIVYGKFFNFPEDEISVFITSITLLGLVILPLELIVLYTLFPL